MRDVCLLQIHHSLPDRVLNLIQIGQATDDGGLVDKYDESTPKHLVLIGEIDRYL